MTTYLIITEKPSVQRKFVKFLLEKIIKVEKYGKARAYVGKRGKDILIIASLAGHVINLDYPEDSAKNWKYPEFLPENRLVWKVLPGKQSYLKLLYKIKSKYKIDYIVVATDVDREGSWLAAEVLEKVFGIKPPYNNPKIKRMFFSAITKREIINAFENLKPFDYNRALAGRTRAIVDLEVGANLTRALTIATGLRLVSSGRVQSPTLYELYKKEKAIEEFKGKKYYLITVTIELEKGIRISLNSNRIDSLELAKKILEKIPKKFYIDIDYKVVFKKPKPPFNITELQTEAFRLFKLLPNQTKKIAQKLYEAGLLSYPRTSATKWNEKYKTRSYFENVILKVSEKFLPDLVKKIRKNLRWPPVEGKLIDEAHPPIHPVGFSKNIPQKHFLIYELVVRRTLATLMPDAKIRKYIFLFTIDNIKFSIEKEKVLEKGWLEVYGKYVNQEDFKYDLDKGKYLAYLIKKKIQEKKEKPPERYTPSSIIKWMERQNLGTRATRDQILEKLYDRVYIEGKRKIRVTDLGKAVVEALEKYCPKILDPKFTSELEKKLDLIEKGLVNYRDVIKDYFRSFEEILKEFKNNEEKIGKEIISKIQDKKLWRKIR